MVHHEKKAFLKFFITYFLSVAILILASGYFYFEQMKSQLLKAEHFSLIEYARHIKMGKSLDAYGKDFHHTYIVKHRHIDIRNFTIGKKEFSKFIPNKNSNRYLEVFKSKKHYEMKLTQLMFRIILVQIMLLFIFGLISYFLARSALKPLQHSIETLDTFAKDLIHDLNTPVTAMKLNMKLLEKQEICRSGKAFERLKKSVDTISELRSNLTILLENKTFKVQVVNICRIVNDVVELHQPNYPNLQFILACNALKVKTNENAMKQILHNLISNACKYNSPNGYVKIYAKDKATLCIQDSGVGIKDGSKIFDREYSAQNSSGLGLDIVKRLCDSMHIKIEVHSDAQGSYFFLTFS